MNLFALRWWITHPREFGFAAALDVCFDLPNHSPKKALIEGSLEKYKSLVAIPYIWLALKKDLSFLKVSSPGKVCLKLLVVITPPARQAHSHPSEDFKLVGPRINRDRFQASSKAARILVNGVDFFKFKSYSFLNQPIPIRFVLQRICFIRELCIDFRVCF